MINPAEEPVWGLLIATYPFITGIVAGAFIVSALAHIFNKRQYLPLTGLALIIAFSFLLAAPIPLALDLGRPERAFLIYLTPSPSSAIAVFGYLLITLIVLYIVEAFFLFRPAYAKKAQAATIPGSPRHLFGALYGLLARGYSPSSLTRHEKAVKILVAIGLPLAPPFHVYAGFLFASVKAREMWASPLTSIAFLLSAIASGAALVALIYAIIGRKERKTEILGSLMVLVGWVLILDLAFFFTDISYLAYTATESWSLITQIYSGPLLGSLIFQILVGSAIPLILIAIPRVRTSTAGVLVASLLILAGVFAYRWNVVIGGQLLAKLEATLLTYTPTPFEIYGSIFSVAVAFIIVAIFVYVVPWREVEASYIKPIGREAEVRK